MDTPPPPARPPIEPGRPEGVPERIGRYEIARLLGQGGMGRVYLARDTVLGRYVAVKVLRDDLGLPPETRASLFARMRQEARAAAAIAHPNLVTLHDMGEEPEVGLYLVFAYVSGPTLRDRIAEGPLDSAMVARMARELGDALTVAHRAGVIHRDVKPENVILSAYGAKLTDFGIARLGDSTLTSAGTVLGTPAYSAPEALALAEFSPQSDQFSLAVTLFEAIGGRRAFPGDDALTIATRIATEPAPVLPASSAEPRLVARLDTILTRAMARDPAKRYPSCRAFGDALANAIEVRTIDTPRFDLSGPKSIIPRATRRVHNLIAAVALLVIVALVVFGRQQPQGDGVSMKHVADSFASAARTAPAASHHRHPAPPGAAAPEASSSPPSPAPSASLAHSDAGAATVDVTQTTSAPSSPADDASDTTSSSE